MEDRKVCISVIRGLINTSKQLSSIRDIEREYREFEGQSIPFRKFGFASLQDFLRDSNEFQFSQDRNGEVLVTLRLSKNDEHIAKMVQSQKPGKKPKGHVKRLQYKVPVHWKPPIRRPVPATSTFNHAKRSGSGFYPQPVTKVFNHVPSNSMTLYSDSKPYGFAMPPANNQRAQPSCYKPHPVPNPRPNPVPMSEIVKGISTLRLNGNQQQVKPKVAMAAATTATTSAPQRKPQPVKPKAAIDSSTEYRSVSLQIKLNQNSNTRETTVTPFRPPPTIAPVPSPSTSAKKRSRQPRSTFSAQNRLKIKPPQEMTIIGKDDDGQVSRDSGCLSEKFNELSRRSGFIENIDLSTLDDGGDPVGRLMEICDKLQCTVHYEYYRMKNTIRCRVTINERTYTSYPADCSSEKQAQEVAARSALYQLGLDIMRKSYPVCDEGDLVVAMKLYEMLQTFPNGVLDKSLPQYFQKIYGLSLPSHWTDIIGTYSKYFECDNGMSYCIIYARSVAESEDDDEGPSDGGEEAVVEAEICEPLQLPWTKKEWSVYVCTTASTTSITGRLIGNDYSERLNDMLARVHKHMERTMAAESGATKVERLKIYLVEEDSTWYRVRCQEKDTENNRALCYFLDVGDEGWYSNEELYPCPPEFLKVPAQCIYFSMYGLEMFDNNPEVSSKLEELMKNMVVKAEILTKPEEFAKTDKVKANFFDLKGGNLLAQLVALLLNDSCVVAPQPQLDAVGILTNVQVTHIDDNGDIYCQTKGSGCQYIQKLIESAIKNVAEKPMQRYRGLVPNDSPPKRWYLVYDRPQKKWYRALLDVRGKDGHKMYCFDYGFKRMILAEDVYDLESLSSTLRKYPALAIKCNLHGFSKVDAHVVGRLRALLNWDMPTLAKVMEKGDVPTVSLYQRLGANNVMVCLNDSIRMEQELDGLDIDT